MTRNCEVKALYGGDYVTSKEFPRHRKLNFTAKISMAFHDAKSSKTKLSYVQRAYQLNDGKL